MAILAGIDLLAKFDAGDDDNGRGKVGKRFRSFFKRYFGATTAADEDLIYQLRNSLLHSFGLYSKQGGRTFRFLLTASGGTTLVTRLGGEDYHVDLGVLHLRFEEAAAKYQAAVESNPDLQKRFLAMFPKYGQCHIR